MLGYVDKICDKAIQIFIYIWSPYWLKNTYDTLIRGTGEYDRKSNQNSIWFRNGGGEFFKSSTNNNMISNHCVSDSGHLIRMVLALPWSQSDYNNDATSIRSDYSILTL